jgi:hypothetical protein
MDDFVETGGVHLRFNPVSIGLPGFDSLAFPPTRPTQRRRAMGLAGPTIILALPGGYRFQPKIQVPDKYVIAALADPYGHMRRR